MKPTPIYQDHTARKQKPFQRVSKYDAEIILEKLINSYKDPCQNALAYVEDYAGGSQEFINRSVVEQLIEKLCR
jgi:hypothetical protein